MQPDLPWNVAGIPPEAREAARAAARREGLSVGEWLTRRIVKSLMDVHETNGNGWARNGTNGHHATSAPQNGQNGSAGHGAEEMLERVSHSEIETNTAGRKFEERLQALTRRLDAAEQIHAENSRAVSQAATEINIAAREQTQAFDKLGIHVAGIDDRLSRVEQDDAVEGIKDAVKGLHAGLARLTDQITDINGQTAAEIATVTREIEAVVAHIGDVRSELDGARREAEHSVHSVASRVTDFDGRMQTAENAARTTAEKLDTALIRIEAIVARIGDVRSDLDSARREAEHSVHSVASRVAEFDGRMQTAESAARATAEKLDTALTGIDAVATRLDHMRNDLDGARREAEHSVHSVASRVADFDSRMQTAESAARTTAEKLDTAFTGIEIVTARLDDVRNDLDGARGKAEHSLHAVASRVADFDGRMQTAESAARTTAEKLDTAFTGIEAVTARLDDVRNDLDGARRDGENSVLAIASRVAELDERMQMAESAAHTTGGKLDTVLGGIEALRDTQHDAQSESQRHAQFVSQLSDALDKLTMRLTATSAQTAGAMARLEDQITAVDARRNEAPLDRRLLGVEHALADITGRLENAERHAAGAARMIEENFRNFSIRLDAAEKLQREAAADAHAAAQQAAPLVSTTAPAVPSLGAIFDLPPFPDMESPLFPHPPQPFTPPPAVEPAPVEASVEAPFETPFEVPFHTEEFAADPIFAADVPAPQATAAVEPQLAEPADSYLAAARRSARAAADADVQPAPKASVGGFSWGITPEAAPVEQLASKSVPTRFLLVAGIVVIAIGAVIAGMLLSHGLVGNEPAPTATAAIRTTIPAVAVPPPARTATISAPQAAAPGVSNSAAATAAPGSPVLRPRHLLRTKAAAVQVQPAPRIQPAALQTVSALDRLTSLAAGGSAKAELLLGLRYLDGDGTTENEAEAAKWLERAANKGEAVAAYRLGTLYERGRGVPADPAKAMRWYAAAAKLGNRKAMHNLAVAYAEGSGTQKDLTQAAQWFSKAATLGLADSEFNLAVLYERGMGVQQSLMDAYKWYAIAAAQGDAESKARLDVIATQLNPDERAAAQKAAAEFRPLPFNHEANVPPDSSVVG